MMNLIRTRAGAPIRRLLTSLVALSWLSIAIPASAADDPTSVTFTILNTCSDNYGGGSFDLKINGVTVGSINAAASCTCDPPLITFTTSDPAALAAVGAPKCSVAEVALNGTTLFAWAKAEITHSVSGTETLCINDYSGGNCTESNLCTANYAYFSNNLDVSSTLADTDGDADLDCTDPDDDNDSVLDGSDNCPLTANLSQSDCDDDGIGDACDDDPDYDGDDVADLCDLDDDNDTVLDVADNCPLTPNADQADSDGNGNGDACQPTLMMPKRDARIGAPVVVWGVSSLADGTEFTLDYGDGLPVTAGSVDDRSYIAFEHTYNTQGIFTATLTVGAETATTTVTVFDPALLPGGAIGNDNRSLGINMAIQDGLRYLWTAQNNRAANFPNGTQTTWGSILSSETALVVLAFQNHGYKLPSNPVAYPTGLYEKYVVRRGLNFVIASQKTITIGVTPQGDNPCVGMGADCTGLYDGRYDDFHQSYTTALAILPLASSGALGRTVTAADATGNLSEGYVVGKTYGEILQRLVNALAWGQVDNDGSAAARGGWYYNFNAYDSDGSTIGWDILAMLDAGAAGAIVPSWVPTEFANALTGHLNTDGSLDYPADGDPDYDNSVGPQKNGIGLQGLYWIGEITGARVDAVKANINSWWPGADPYGIGGNGWGGADNHGSGYTMFNFFKGLKLQGIATLPAVTRPAGPGAQPAGDWYADYQDWFVANQTAPTTTGGGNWETMEFSCCHNDNQITAAVAELILSPVALVLPDGDKFSTVGLSPATHTDVEGGIHTVTAKAESTGGTPVPGATVNFTILKGPNAGLIGTDTTAANGEATFTYTDQGPDGTYGTDTIRATIGSLNSNTVEMIWTAKPVALCQDVTVFVGTPCEGSADIDDGSYDPDGDAIVITQSPAGPYGVGATIVTITVTDASGASSTCTATVTVVDNEVPSGNVIALAPAAALSNVPEAADYSLIYSLDIPNASNWDVPSSVPYSVDNSGAGVAFDRVAYFLELDNQWVWVSMDAFTTSLAATGLPYDVNGNFQQTVNNMNVFSNTGLITTGTGIATGNIEFWDNCYAVTQSPGLPNGSNTVYDYDDSPSGANNCYGSLQVHNYGANETVFSYNSWSNTNNQITDLGIGNNTVLTTNDNRINPDWTFRRNAPSYTIKRLYVLVHAAEQLPLACNDITVQLDASGSVSIDADDVDGGNSDNCGIATRTIDTTDFDCANIGANVVTLTITDIHGNVSTCQATVTVVDNERPVITSCPADVTLECPADTSVAATGEATATDNCGVTVVLAETETPGCGQTKTISRTWMATDGSGNAASCTQTINVVDTTQPTLSVPADATVECRGDTSPAATGMATASDRCGDVTVSSTDASVVGCGNTTVITRTWTVTDACGNAAIGVQTIAVVDTTRPSLSVPADTTVECGGDTSPVATGTATASDSCGNTAITSSDSEAPGACGNTRTIIRTWTATDDCGNSVSGVQTIAVVDTTPPTLNLPADTTLECTSITTPDVTGLATGADACGGVVVTWSDSFAPACGYSGVIARTWTATDACGNSASADQIITVVDTTRPSLSLPANATVECTGDTSPGATGTATATDGCGSATVAYSDSFAAGCGNAGVITRTWTATDECGNSAFGGQIITVVDTTRPSLSLPADATVECAGDTSPAATGTATTTDGCGTATVGYSDSFAAGCGNAGVITRTWTATDECGNSAFGDQIIAVVDTTPPTLNMPPDLTAQCPFDTSYITTGSATATDACGTPVIGHSDVVVPGCGSTVTITRTWTAADACGNVSSASQIITSFDTIAPTPIAPASATVECGGDTSPAATGEATISETFTCSAISLTYSDESVPGCGNTETITRTWTATDECGNSVSSDQIITVVDTTRPSLSVPANAAVECTGDTSPGATGTATTTDGCGSATVAYSDSFAAGCGNAGVITRTWTATDECGNSAFGDQIIAVVDSTPPSLSVPADAIVECTGDTSPGATGTATATDGCGSATVAYGDSFGSGCGLTGTITRTWAATDACGNTANAVQTIRVVDTTAPTLNLPPNVTVECGASTSSSATGVATAVDTCGDVIITNSDAMTDGCGATGLISRTWTAIDACGNSVSGVQTIAIVDTTPPVISPAATNLTLQCGASGNDAAVAAWLASNGGGAAATDTCGGVTWSSNFAGYSNACTSSDVTITVTFTATDDCGNSASTSATLTIEGQGAGSGSGSGGSRGDDDDDDDRGKDKDKGKDNNKGAGKGKDSDKGAGSGSNKGSDSGNGKDSGKGKK